MLYATSSNNSGTGGRTADIIRVMNTTQKQLSLQLAALTQDDDGV